MPTVGREHERGIKSGSCRAIYGLLVSCLLAACGSDDGLPGLPASSLSGTYLVTMPGMHPCEWASVTMGDTWHACVLSGSVVIKEDGWVELQNGVGYAEFMFHDFTGTPEAAEAQVVGSCRLPIGPNCEREAATSTWTGEE